MTRSKWLKRAGFACETIHTRVGDAPFYCIIHDDHGRDAHGWGFTEEQAFKDAHDTFAAARRRANMSAAERIER